MGTSLGNGGLWWNFFPKGGRKFRSRRNGGGGGESSGTGVSKFKFPLKQAATAASLTLAGDSIAQLTSRWKTIPPGSDNKDIMATLVSNHDWIRALRMTSYGFLLYGPGSHSWYRYLDRTLPKPTVGNLLLKVLLNQIVLGPTVIAVIFAWNNLWKGTLSELPDMYQKDALPTLLYGFRFWVPVSVLNFWVIPLQTRVAYMSTCSIFWNFYLSTAMSNNQFVVYGIRPRQLSQ